MTAVEFQTLLQELKATFPMVGKWVYDLPREALQKWQSTLAGTDLATALVVVGEWFNAPVNPLREPTSWQEIPVMLRREVYGKLNKPDENWRTPNHYRPSQDRVLMPYMDLIRANAKQFKAGTIDDAEYKQRTRDLLAQFDDGITEPVSPLTPAPQ